MGRSRTIGDGGVVWRDELKGESFQYHGKRARDQRLEWSGQYAQESSFLDVFLCCIVARSIG